MSVLSWWADVGLLRRRTASSALAAQSSTVVSIHDAPERRGCVIEGQVTRMRARPADGVPSLAVTLTDTTGSVTAVWTGRRSIGGITLGRRLRLEGVGTRQGDRLEFTNPRYTLLP